MKEPPLIIKLRSDKAFYSYIVTFFAFLFLAAGLYLEYAIAIGITKMINDRIYDDWQLAIAGFSAVLVCFFIPAIILFRLLPKRIVMKEDRIFLVYPFGYINEIKMNVGYVLYRACYPINEDMAIVWVPFFRFFIVGSLFYGNKRNLLNIVGKNKQPQD